MGWMGMMFPIMMMGQYEFDSLTKPNYVINNNWYHIDYDSVYINHTLITTKGFYKDGSDLTFQFTQDKMDNTIMVYKDYKTIQFFFHINQGYGFHIHSGIDEYPLQIADLNGDGLKDIKLIYSSLGNGLWFCKYYVLYFIQNEDGTFTLYSPANLLIFGFIEEKNFEIKRIEQERDFNKDGKFEFLQVDYTQLNDHAYWDFNVYEFSKDSAVNVSLKYGYPMLVPYNYEPTFNRTKVPFNKSDYLMNESIKPNHGTKVK